MRRIETLSRDDCLRLLGTQQVGRVAVVDHGYPHVMPVNYAMDGDAVVFRTASGLKLDGASRSPMAFEVDEIDRDGRIGWSVVVHGVAQEVTEHDRRDLVSRVRALDVEPWAPGEKPHFVRLPAHTVTGRQLLADGYR